MKTGKVTELLNTSKTNVLDKVKKYNLDIAKNNSGDNIFRWSDIAKLYRNMYFPKLKTPFVLSISHNKGGVGKTTSTINFGYLFSCLGKTLLIDMDAQANLSQAFDVYKSKTDVTIKDVLDNPEKIHESICEINENLSIIPNTSSFELWKKQSVMKRNSQYLLQKAIKSIKSDYDFILIDCPPGLDLAFELSMYASNYCLIMLDGHPFSMENLENIADEINRIVEDDMTGLLDLKILGGLFTRQKETVINKDIVKTAQSKNIQIFENKIRETIQIPESQALKQPIFLYNEMSNGSFDYFKAWVEVLEKIDG